MNPFDPKLFYQLLQTTLILPAKKLFLSIFASYKKQFLTMSFFVFYRRVLMTYYEKILENQLKILNLTRGLDITRLNREPARFHIG